ncbi:MAG: YihY/virulence factor BrkB family protein [Ruminococcus sp.]|nr:YihY/virulence factor BrkB family protein [Ruminococcus sp.]
MKKKYRILGHIKHFINKSNRDNISAIAAQSTFFILLSVVPFLMFTFALLSIFGVPQNLFETYAYDILTSDVRPYVEKIIVETYENSVGVAYTTIVLALWSSGRGLYSITEGIRRIYRIRDRNWFVKRLLAAGYTFIMFLVLVLSVVGFVVCELLDHAISPYLEKLPYSIGLLYALRYVILFVLIVLLIAFALKLYLRNKVSDKRRASFGLQLPGAVLTALCWVLLSLGIRIYVDYFNGFSIYGSLGTAALIMVWMYFCMYIFLCSVQLNFIYRSRIDRLFKKILKNF